MRGTFNSSTFNDATFNNRVAVAQDPVSSSVPIGVLVPTVSRTVAFDRDSSSLVGTLATATRLMGFTRIAGDKTTTISQSLSNSSASIYTGYRIRRGERFTAWPASTISSIDFSLSKVGSPTGTLYVRVRKVSDDSILGTLGSINVATLTTSPAWYTFDTTEVTNPIAQDIRILAEYNVGDSSNYVEIGLQSTNAYANGAWTSYRQIEGYTDTVTYDATWRNLICPDVSDVLYIGVATPTATRAWGRTRTSSVLVGVVAAATRTATFARSSAVSVGNKVSAVAEWMSGAAHYLVESAIAIGVVATASKSWGRARTSPVIVGVVTTATKTVAFLRSPSVLTGVLVAATREVAFARSSDVLVGIVAAVTRAVTFIRSSTVSIGNLVSATIDYAGHIKQYFVGAAVAIGVVTVATREFVISRTSAVLVGVRIVVSKAWGRAITSAVLVGVKVTATRLVAFVRSPSILIGILPTVTRAVTFSRTSSVLIGVKVTATRVVTYSRSTAVLIGNLVSATRTTAYQRTPQVLIGIVTAATRAVNFTRSAATLVGNLVSVSINYIPIVGTHFVIAASVVVGVVASATRRVAFSRNSTILAGVKVAATVIRAIWKYWKKVTME